MAQPDRLVVRLAETTIGCYAGFGLGVVLMHVLRPDYAPASHMISDYAVGAWSPVMTGAFVCAGLGCLTLALALLRHRPATIAGWLATALLGVGWIGLFVTAVFPTDPPGTPSTTSGDIHDISFLVNVGSLVLTAVLIGVVSMRDERWRAHRPLAVGLALLLMLALIVQFKTLHRGMPYGLANRFFVAVMVTWFVVTAMRLRRLGLSGGVPSST